MKTMNFNTLTKEKPVYLVEDGIYNAKIVTAELRDNKSQTGKCLFIRMDIFDNEGKRLNGIFEIFSEVPEITDDMPKKERNKAEILGHKLYRFIRATKIELPENFTLKDVLDNMSTAKEFKVDVTTQNQEGYSNRNVVNFYSEMFYTLEEEIDEEIASRVAQAIHNEIDAI